MLELVTVQALAAESIVQTLPVTLVCGVGVALAAVVAAAFVIERAGRARRLRRVPGATAAGKRAS